MVKKIKQYINRSEFLKNVLTLMTGTTIAQAIPLAISPILSRLFTPEDFGLFALYMSIVSVIAIIATGRYELAIMLPKKDRDAFKVVILSVFLTIVVSVFSLIIIVIFNTDIVNLFSNKALSGWLYFVPLSVLLIAFFQIFYYWINRNKEYLKLAKSRVLQSIFTASSNLGFGFSKIGSGLIMSSIIGQFISTTYLGFFVLKNKSLFSKIKSKEVFNIAKKYSDFLKFDVLASFFNVLTPQSIIFLLGSLFNLALVGVFSFTFRVLLTPISIVASAIFDAFKQKATEDYNNIGNCRNIYVKTFKSLFLLSIIPFTILFFFGAEIFEFVFGDEWREAGEIAEILSPMFMLKFISSPLSYTFYIANKQKHNLFGQMLLLLFTILSVYIGYYFNNTKLLFVLITVSYSIIYIIYLFFSYKFSK